MKPNARQRASDCRRAQVTLELMLSFAAYAALIAAFVFAARGAGQAATPKTQLAAGAVEARAACLTLEYAQANLRHSLVDLRSLEAAQANEGLVTVKTPAGDAGAECAAAARSQGRITVKQNDNEQA